MCTCILFIVSRAILNFQIDIVKRTPSLYTTRYLTFVYTWQVTAWPNFYTPEREVCLPSHWIATMVPHRYWTGGLRNDPVWNSFYTDNIVFFSQLVCSSTAIRDGAAYMCRSGVMYQSYQWFICEYSLKTFFTWALCSRGTLFSWNLKESINTAWFRRTLSRHWYNVKGWLCIILACIL